MPIKSIESLQDLNEMRESIKQRERYEDRFTEVALFKIIDTLNELEKRINNEH